MKNRMSILMLLLSLSIVGCLQGISGQMAPEKLDQVVAIARNIAVKNYPDIDGESKKIINDSYPFYRYHIASGNFGQYSFEWKITEERVLRVFGEGDIETLENAQCEIKEQ